jgi:hypothetical protein
VIQTEKHIAVCADNQDPEQRGRIRVRCVGILGDDETILDRWVDPCFDWGWFYVPDLEEQVEIEVASSSDTDEVKGQSFVDEPDIRYRGKRFYGEGITSVNEMFKSSNYGKRRGFATPGGHILMFDDTAESEKINLVWHSSEDGWAMFSIDEDGSVIIANKNGSMVYLNAANAEIAIIDENGNSLSMNSDGIKLVDKSGNSLEVNATNGVTVQAGSVSIGGLSGLEPVLLATTFLGYFRSHTHPDPVSGFTGSPVEIPPGLWDAAKSGVIQTK